MTSEALKPFVFVNPKEYRKIGLLFLAMCAIAHVRRKEMQKRWLKPNQKPRLADHPAVAYLVENSTIFGIAYLLLRFVPKPKQNNPLLTYMITATTGILVVELPMFLAKMTTKLLYSHVPWFSERNYPEDWKTLFYEFMCCNMPAIGFGNFVLVYTLCNMPLDTFNARVLNPKPLEILPFLAKFVYSRIVVDIVFGVAHRLMHEYPAVYNAIHRRHHEHTTPRTQTNYHFEFIDIFIEAFLPVQVAFLSLQAIGHSANNIEQLCMTAAFIYYESSSHTGKEIPTVTWIPMLSPLVNYLTGCDQRLIEYHTKHHQLFRCNYSISPWFDKLCGTYRMDLPSSYVTKQAVDVDVNNDQ